MTVSAHRVFPLILLLSACAPPATGDLPVESFDFEVKVVIDDIEPTVIVVSWETDEPGPSWVEFGLDLDRDQSTFVEDEGSRLHVFRLVGLPAETEVFFRAVTEVDGVERSTTASAWTEAFPEELPTFKIEGIDPSSIAPHDYVAGSVFTSVTGVFVADRAGRLLWFGQEDNDTNIPKLEFRNGTNEILALATPIRFGTRDAEIHRISIADGTRESIRLIGGAHHAFTQLPDGSIAYIHADIREWVDPTDQTILVAGDAIAIRTPDGETSELFSIWDWSEPAMNPWWHDAYYPNAANWTHANALDYDANTDTLLLSLRNTRMVVEVDVRSGHPVRWFGQREGYGFAAGSRPFYFQHDVKWSPSGTLLASNTHDHETVGIEYEVDEDARLLREVWSYGDDMGIQAVFHGGIEALDNGNRLVNWGSTPKAKEATPDGRTVWAFTVAHENPFGLIALQPMTGFYDLQ
ncbi:MAG: aryl-sulfate sulfotransferase [Deltaproteobacteria bacterium]|nr:aryl-sulfate sulfotransferase [Deltaproteobacteria bacterium]